MTDVRTDAQGRQLPPWEQPEHLAYLAARQAPTDLTWRLSPYRAIRVHGLLTEVAASQRHKLDLLVSLRTGITPEPDISESILADSIADYEAMIGELSTLIYGGNE